RPRREFLLAHALDDAHASYEEILIDCPPSLNLLTINALVAADRVLVPLQCEFYALEGLAQLMQTIARVQRALNPRLALEGVLLTMYDRRNNLGDLVAADVRGHFGAKVYETMIHAMSASPRRRRTGSRCCFTTAAVRVHAPMCGSPPSCCGKWT